MPPAARRLVLALIVLIPLLSLGPAVAGYVLERPPDRIFLGFPVLEEDHFQYGSFLAQARDDGRLLMENRLTSEPQRGRFVLLYLWLAGTFARLSGLPDASAWIVLQFLMNACLLLSTWLAARWFVRTAEERVWAFVLVAVGSGIDWVPWILAREGVPGAASFMSGHDSFWNWSTLGVLQLPMWCCAEALLLALLAAVAASGDPGLPAARRWALRVALAVLPLVGWLVHAYTALAGLAVLATLPAVDALLRLARAERPDPQVARSRLATCGLALAMAAPLAAFTLWCRRDPVVAAVSDHAFAWKVFPSPLSFLPGYGIVLVFAWFGLAEAWGGSGLPRDLLLAWTLAVAALALNPWMCGIKFLYLLHVPLCFLAARGLTSLRGRVAWFGRAWERRPFRAGVLTAVVAGSLVLPARILHDLAHDPLYYASADELAAYEVLRQQPPGIVLSAVEAGPRVAWKSGHVSFAGHWFMTLDYDRKAWLVDSFFGPQTSVAWRESVAAKEHLSYVLVSPSARAAGFDATTVGDVLFDSGGWQVARLRTAVPAP